jgi:ABC-2 type transport system permease protein
MMTMLRLILTLATKDCQLFWADRRAALLGFAVPIILASAFGMVFHAGPKSDSQPKLPLVVVVEEHHPFTDAVVSQLISGTRVEAEIVSLAEARKRVADRRPGVAVIFPRGFEKLAQWQPGCGEAKSAVRIEHNPLATSEGQWAEGVVSEAIMKCLAKERLSPLMALQGKTASEADFAMPFAIETTSVIGASQAGFNAYSHSFCGMTLQYLLFWGMESGLLLLRERRQSLWTRMRAAPVPLWAVLFGKTLSTASIAMLQVLCTFAFGYFVFNVTITGSFFGFLALAFAAGLLAAATGLLVAAIGGTEARARSVCILVILGVSMLGGLWLPSFVLPGWARDLALSLPTTWAMQGLDAVTWQGRSLGAVLPNVGVVLGFTAMFLTVAVARFISTEARRRRGGA